MPLLMWDASCDDICFNTSVIGDFVLICCSNGIRDYTVANSGIYILAICCKYPPPPSTIHTVFPWLTFPILSEPPQRCQVRNYDYEFHRQAPCQPCEGGRLACRQGAIRYGKLCARYKGYQFKTTVVDGKSGEAVRRARRHSSKGWKRNLGQYFPNYYKTI